MTKKIIRNTLMALFLLPLLAVAGDSPAGTLKANWTPIQFSIWKPIQVVDEGYNVYGLRLNIFYGLNKDVRGLDMGIGLNESASMYGIQFSMFLNKVTESMLGMQFGMINKAGRVGGIQTGLINDTKNLAGLQFGLININRNGWLPFFPMMNIGFTYMTAEEKAQAKAAEEEKKKAAETPVEEKKATPADGKTTEGTPTEVKPADDAANRQQGAPEQGKPAEQAKPEQGKPEQPKPAGQPK
jgi:hypothetical protein